MKTKEKIFIGVIILDGAGLLFLFLAKTKILHTQIEIDNTSLILVFGIIALSILPFATKIKVGEYLEFEKWQDKIQSIEQTQLLGEVVTTPNSLEYYYNDANGLHKIPDNETLDFLKSAKGIITIDKSEFKKIKHSNEDIESVKKGKLIKDNQGTTFVILNNKKYYINSWSIIHDWRRDDNTATEVSLDEILGYPSAK